MFRQDCLDLIEEAYADMVNYALEHDRERTVTSIKLLQNRLEFYKSDFLT